jgi:hypothetical protein
MNKGLKLLRLGLLLDQLDIDLLQLSAPDPFDSYSKDAGPHQCVRAEPRLSP